MTLPHYVARDYSGGVVEGVQLTAQIGSGDLSFTIATTTGWVNAAGQPLGTVGPFTCIIDLGAASAEKILCSSVNLTSGLVTVYNSGGTTGRGYDQTTAQAHVPGGSPSGVQPCWSAVEAAEANAAVVYGPGGGGALIGLTGNPAGRCFASTGTAEPSGVTNVILDTSSFENGGMAFTSASGSGLLVPKTGYYQVNGVVRLQPDATPYLVSTALCKNNTLTPLALGNEQGVGGTTFQASTVSDVLQLSANDVINLAYVTSQIVAFQSGSSSVFLSASLVSV